MKKFYKTFLVIALVVVFALPVFAGCSFSDLFGKKTTTPTKSVVSIDLVGTIKTEYVVGDEFDANGARVKATYDDNSTYAVALEANMTNFNSSTRGVKELVITYEGQTKVVQYRVDTFKLGTYHQRIDYLNDNDEVVYTDTYATTKQDFIFNTEGSVVILGNGNPVSSGATWEYVGSRTVSIDLHDDLNQIVGCAIIDTTTLRWVFSTQHGTKNGHEFSKSVAILEYVE